MFSKLKKYVTKMLRNINSFDILIIFYNEKKN